jgi:hypothetical protein
VTDVSFPELFHIGIDNSLAQLLDCQGLAPGTHVLAANLNDLVQRETLAAL